MKEYLRLAKTAAITLGAGLIVLLGLRIAESMSVVYNEPLANETGLAFNNTYPLNLNSYKADNISFQVTYGSMSPTTATFKDGTQSTGSITVVSNTAITTATASDFMTIVATNGFSGGNIVVAGITLKEGVQWGMDVNGSTATAISIASAITKYVSNVVASTGTSGGKPVIFTTATVGGMWGNNITLVSNISSITVNSANFTGGQDNACVSVNGTILCANRDFVVGASSQATATNIAAAFNANAAISAIITSTAGAPGAGTAGIVVSTSVITGTAANYALFSSSQAALQLSAPVTKTLGTATNTMFGGTNNASSFNTGKITIANHGYTSSLQVLYTTSSGVAFTGLTWGTTYFIIPVDANTVELATTSANAQGGSIFATITSSSAQTTAHSFVLTPLAISGASSYKYQGSNDGSTWTDLTTPSSYTIGTSFVFPTTSTIVDVGAIDYSQIRVNVVAPTAGGLVFKVVPNAKTTK